MKYISTRVFNRSVVLCVTMIMAVCLWCLGCTDDGSPSASPAIQAGESTSDMMTSEPAGECLPSSGGDEVRSAGEATGGVAGDVAGVDSSGGQIMGGQDAGDRVTGGESSGEEAAGDLFAGEEVSGAQMAGGQSAGEETPGAPVAGEQIAGMSMTPEHNLEAATSYDGDYYAALESDGLKSALARFVIREGLIGGEIINRYGENVMLAGFVDAQGVLRIPTLTGDMSNTFNVAGRVNWRGSIEGTFSVSGTRGREGSFAGSLGNQPTEYPTTYHDGLYLLSFIRGSSEVAVVTTHIDQGIFSVGLVTTTGETFEARGFVSSDGTLTLLSLPPYSVFAEAYIDPDSRQIEGMYSVVHDGQTLVGDLKGSVSD